MGSYHKGMRTGKLTSEDRKYIAANVDSMLYTEIAAKLKRNPETIKTYIKKELGREIRRVEQPKSKPVTVDLKSTLIWKDLSKQFNEKELETFIWHWNRIIGQFKDDVFPTEELQILDMIKLEILMNRCMESEKEARDKVEEVKQEMIKEKLLGDIANFDKIAIYEEQIALNKAAYESIHGEYTDLLQRKASILEKLRATREQRIKRIDDSKQSFMGWVNELLDNKSLRRELGLYLEKYRISIDVEEARLQEPHKYLDDAIDLPILSAESLEKFDSTIPEDNVIDGKVIKEE